MHGVALVKWQFDSTGVEDLVPETVAWYEVLRSALCGEVLMAPLGFVVYHFLEVAARCPTAIKDVCLGFIKWDSAVMGVLSSNVAIGSRGVALPLNSVASSWGVVRSRRTSRR